jgi:hypothetical protein
MSRSLGPEPGFPPPEHHRRAKRLQVRSRLDRGVVPAEGIEPPTFGLQNRCSTAELSRLEACLFSGEGSDNQRRVFADERRYQPQTGLSS